MKKFLSIVLALVLICSMATVAFAAPISTTQTNTCPYCNDFTTNDEALYNEHISGGCNVKYRPCKWCGKGFASDDSKAVHEGLCPEGSAKCDYCGETYSPVNAYDAHLDGCKKAHLYIPAAKIGDMIKGLDWNNIVVKVTDFLGTVVEKIVGLF